MKKKRNVIIAVIIVAIIGILAATLMILNNSEKKNRDNNPIGEDIKKQTVISPEELESMTNNVELIEDYVEPGKNTLEVNKIQGFTSRKNVNNSETNAKKSKKKDDETKADTGKTVETVLSDSNLIVESIGSYTGNFIEDGSDETIKAVTALVISNISDKMLQVGDITFQVNDKETASFRVTNLLPHTSVLVLETNKRTYSDKDDYSYGTVVNAYLDKPDLMKKVFKITKENGKLVLKNKTDKSYKKVYVYYKYAQTGGAFLGGITYRVPFENVEGKKSVSSVANHFNANTSVIVDVQIAEE